MGNNIPVKRQRLSELIKKQDSLQAIYKRKHLNVKTDHLKAKNWRKDKHANSRC